MREEESEDGRGVIQVLQLQGRPGRPDAEVPASCPARHRDLSQGPHTKETCVWQVLMDMQLAQAAQAEGLGGCSQESRYQGPGSDHRDRPTFPARAPPGSGSGSSTGGAWRIAFVTLLPGGPSAGPRAREEAKLPFSSRSTSPAALARCRKIPSTCCRPSLSGTERSSRHWLEISVGLILWSTGILGSSGILRTQPEVALASRWTQESGLPEGASTAVAGFRPGLQLLCSGAQPMNPASPHRFQTPSSLPEVKLQMVELTISKQTNTSC
ncbi:uncharacterized protein LOC104867575 [Fukomys damarensis]|uniref:uncharacterized protein LOC104867575 n=1 Tax=Fukomys damarensis TaxID=885580 RepID=UPI000540142A|nr:uncharacterized protein LOC104867575 [Fukomys damarensis]